MHSLLYSIPFILLHCLLRQEHHHMTKMISTTILATFFPSIHVRRSLFKANKKYYDGLFKNDNIHYRWLDYDEFQNIFGIKKPPHDKRSTTYRSVEVRALLYKLPFCNSNISKKLHKMSPCNNIPPFNNQIDPFSRVKE